MEKNVKATGNLPVSHTEVFGLLNSRIHEQSKVIQAQNNRIDDLIEIVNIQNEAIRNSKAVDSDHATKITLAQKYINKMIFDLRESDTEAE